ncbi:hypothetical protein [uncultured Sphaerochaeta sp.]|uniref:hypothetical protein n=1 Tax=uncultured Sphaerochaeta sp. TaxID=886478 RepID=UPI002A0A1175|nr:hypothetical protein [uncultured Sphaerochaeta sp.]
MNQGKTGMRTSVRDNILSSRYRFMVHEKKNLLSYLDLGQIKTVAQVLSTLEDDSFSLHYPFSFADLHLQAYPEISAIYNALDFGMQCQVLDCASEYGKEGNCEALVAVDYQAGLTTIVALGKNQEELEQRALSSLEDPLVKVLIDEPSEKELFDLLEYVHSSLLKVEPTKKRYACYRVACSDEFFLSYLFSTLIDVPFTLTWRLEKDSDGRAIPTFITDGNV